MHNVHMTPFGGHMKGGSALEVGRREEILFLNDITGFSEFQNKFGRSHGSCIGCRLQRRQSIGSQVS